MEKKIWTIPEAVIEQFAANEYVAACYSLYCMVSGNGTSFVQNTWHDAVGSHGWERCDATTNWMGLVTPLDGKLHGSPCANGSSLDQETGNYYESGKLSAVGTITIGESTGDGRNYAVWTSTDVNGTGVYCHYGYAVLDDQNRPNHS